MGEVFRARDTKLDRDVAIKVLPAAFAHDPDRLARFQREAKTLASLNHPNIAAIYGLEETGGMAALVMEFVEGDDLSQRIERGRIPLDEALAIAKQIADALEAAHEQSIVLFSAIADHAERLQQVAESGGMPAALTPLALPKLSLQRWPHFLPDGRHFLFFASARQTETDGVYAGSLGETGARRIVGGFGEARYSDGTLLFVRDTTLMAQPFDATSQVLGPADPVVISSVSNAGNEGGKAFAVSDSGVLIVVPFTAPLRFQLKWFDRGGRWIADLGAPGNQLGPRISPDGLHVLTWSATATGATSGGALWITDVKSGRPQRLTFTDGVYSNNVWSRDATSVFFGLVTGATGVVDVFSQPTNGSASQEALLPSREKEYKSTTSPTGLWVLSLPERTPSLYMRNAGLARLSPGGHWVAYAGNDSGHREIYLQSFPTPAMKFQISEGGGDAPVWSGDGRELFYVAGGRLMAVPVSTTSGNPSIGQPTALFDLPGQPDFDVSADGRFLFAVPVANQTPAAVVTLNWKAGLKK